VLGGYLICNNRAGFRFLKKKPNKKTINSGYLKPWESNNHHPRVFETSGIKEPSAWSI
jgi:hypothetical protein